MARTPILGCIADDLTGSTDLGNNLARAGMHVVLTIDVPAREDAVPADAIIVALKSRTIAVAEAVAQSQRACRWLRRQGARHIYFKVCSTFDSTAQGNIGPVIEALMSELGSELSVVVPAFPDNDRTVFRGHLFVGDALLSESSMRDHPLTPMNDSNLVRFLQAQLATDNGHNVGLIDYRAVAQSDSAIRQRIDELRAQGVTIAIADAVSDDDLERLASALHQDLLVTASSGLGASLPARWGFSPSLKSGELPPAEGRKAIISGSCSKATNAQVQCFVQSGGTAWRLDPLQLVSDHRAQVDQALAWADSWWTRDPNLPLLVYTTAEPAAVKTIHAQMGVGRSGEIVETALANIARGLVERDAGQLVVAGGETSGVCVRALDIRQMQVGAQIDPGVPWCHAASPVRARGLHVTLKSGNFGSLDFFSKAFALLN